MQYIYIRNDVQSINFLILGNVIASSFIRFVSEEWRTVTEANVFEIDSTQVGALTKH